MGAVMVMISEGCCEDEMSYFMYIYVPRYRDRHLIRCPINVGVFVVVIATL